jgi:hypothetical protein
MSNDNRRVLSSLPLARAVPVENVDRFCDQMTRASNDFNDTRNMTNRSDRELRQAIAEAFRTLYFGLRDLRDVVEGSARDNAAGVLRANFVNTMRRLLDLNNALGAGNEYQIPDLSEFVDFERDEPLQLMPALVSACFLAIVFSR